MRLVVPALAVLLLVGCAAREQRHQMASDAIQGAEALVVAPTPASRRVIADGVIANVEGAAGTPRAELPAPTKSVTEIVSDPETYKSEAVESRDESFSGGFWAIIGAAGITGLVGIAKLIQVTGTGGPILGLAARFIESKAQKEQKEQANAALDGLATIVDVVDMLPEDMGGELRERLRGSMSDDAKAVVKALRDRNDARG